MKRGGNKKKKVKLFLSFLCSVLWLLPPTSKMLFCFPCRSVLPVFSLCRPLVFPPFLNNCVPLSARLYLPDTPSIPPPWSLSQQKPKRNWVKLEYLHTWKTERERKKRERLADFTEDEDRNGHLYEWQRLEWYIVDGGGEKCAMKWCVLSGLSAEQHQREVMEEEKFGEDRKVWWWWGGGGKKERKKQNRFSM